MKYIQTFEAYQKYKDYKNSNNFGTPADLKKDAIITLKHVLPTFDDKWIDKVTDMSNENGIKFEFKVDKDTIHMYKLGSFVGQWEFYLNKRKTKGADIKDYLENKYLKDLDKFLQYAPSYDYNVAYIDDGRQYKKAQANNQFILNLFDNLSNSDKKKAIKQLKKSKKEIFTIFKNRI